MKKVFLKYLKDNRLYIIVMVVCFLALLAQMLQVVYQADDYSVGILSGSSINVLMENAVDHYLHWGGGYTPTIVISLISLPSIVWRLVITEWADKDQQEYRQREFVKVKALTAKPIHFER